MGASKPPPTGIKCPGFVLESAPFASRSCNAHATSGNGDDSPGVGVLAVEPPPMCAPSVNAPTVSGMPRPVPSSLASKPSALREWATSPPAQSLPSPPPPRARGAMLGEGLSPASRRGAGCPRKPSGSRSIGGRSRQSPVSRRANTRRRRWGTARGCDSTRTYCASSTRHSTSPCEPIAAPHVPHPPRGTPSSHPAIDPTTIPKSRPPWLENAPGTFSQSRKRAPQRALAAWKILTCSWKRLERSPASPARLPATLRSWHGDPPTTRSMGPRAAIRASVIAVTSPRFGTPG